MTEQDRGRASPEKSGAKSRTRARPNPKERSEPLRNPVFDLQRTAGNQAVVNLFESGALQAKLRVSQPQDADEVEADRVADQVISTGSAFAAPSATADTIHRKCKCPGGVASCPDCEEEEVEQAKGIHRKSNQPAQQEQSVHDDFLQSLGPGQPLDPATRLFMESRFGHDFGHVRVHTDEAAGDSARCLTARAFTLDHNIAFEKGAYAPHTTDGRRLLAHELSHVVQQRSSSPASPRSGLGLSASGPRKVQRDLSDIVLGPGKALVKKAAGWLVDPRTKQFADDLLASVKEAPQHVGEVLVGEVWEAIKEHWVSFLAVTIGMITAETIIGILTAVPEPTLLTKVVAVILQLLVAAIVGYFAGVELAGVYEEGRNWFSLAKEANGDPKKITEASKSFLRMVRHIILAILALIGARAKIRGGLRVPGSAVGETPVATPPTEVKAPPVEPTTPAAVPKPPAVEPAPPPKAPPPVPKPPAAEAKSPVVEQKSPTVEQKAPAVTPQALENAARDAAGKATKAPAEGQLSEAGRSLSKHARGQRPGSKGFPEIKGGPAEINTQAANILDQILKDPNKIIKVRPGRGGEQILQVSRPDGTGAIFTMQNGQWTFSYFAENLY
ncbi:MAG TPA: DUF4157 domain-containing protein [Candidatus Bathyarchaeia archaeon]|nr:DUF4157 domain-containing protein [Candidatus Bathyarchaeia archaeon]